LKNPSYLLPLHKGLYMHKYYNKKNVQDDVMIEISLHSYCQLIPNYFVYVVNKAGEALHHAEVHERAYPEYVAQLQREFNVIQVQDC